MICPFSHKPCNKPAVINITEMVDGKQKKFEACEDCAGKLNQTLFNDSFKLLAPIDFMLSASETKSDPDLSLLQDANRKCNCGITLIEFVKNGRLGCADCYKTFSDFLLPTIKQICGSTKHVGKVPKKYRVKKEIAALEAEMVIAVKQENYERAAEIRDRLKELQSIISK